MIDDHRLALRALGEKLRREPGAMLVPWPGGNEPPPLKKFERLEDWIAAIEALGLTIRVPDALAAKYLVALKHHVVAWIDLELIKAGEWAAFGALEYALNDRYGWLIHQREQAASEKPARFKPKGLSKCLDYMLAHDGLTDEVFRFSLKYRIPATEQLKVRGSIRPSLHERRNQLNHGHLTDAFPVGGMLELIRDLID